jgi:hypothetical protein
MIILQRERNPETRTRRERTLPERGDQRAVILDRVG